MPKIDSDKGELFREAWLFRNEEALRSVRRGLKQAEEGKLTYWGSFAQYIAEENGAIPSQKDEIKFE